VNQGYLAERRSSFEEFTEPEQEGVYSRELEDQRTSCAEDYIRESQRLRISAESDHEGDLSRREEEERVLSAEDYIAATTQGFRTESNQQGGSNRQSEDSSLHYYAHSHHSPSKHRGCKEKIRARSEKSCCQKSTICNSSSNFNSSSNSNPAPSYTPSSSFNLSSSTNPPPSYERQRPRHPSPPNYTSNIQSRVTKTNFGPVDSGTKSFLKGHRSASHEPTRPNYPLPSKYPASSKYPSTPKHSHNTESWGSSTRFEKTDNASTTKAQYDDHPYVSTKVQYNDPPYVPTKFQYSDLPPTATKSQYNDRSYVSPKAQYNDSPYVPTTKSKPTMEPTRAPIKETTTRVSYKYSSVDLLPGKRGRKPTVPVSRKR